MSRRFGWSFFISATIHAALVALGFALGQGRFTTAPAPTAVPFDVGTSSGVGVHDSHAPLSVAPGAQIETSANGSVTRVTPLIMKGANPSAPAAPVAQDAPPADSQAERVGYFMRLREHIQKNLAYPAGLQSRRIQGRVEIEVMIEPSGRLRSVNVIRSSGHPELDRIALESAQGSAPFEPFLGNNSRSARIPIDFTLRSR